MFSDTFKIEIENLLNRKSLTIKIPPEQQISIFPLNYIESYKTKEPNIHIKLFEKIQTYKAFIDLVPDKNKLKWNKLKLFTNLFELVSYHNQAMNIYPLIHYIPLSRAYFKLHELIVNYDLIDNSQQTIRYAGLAEGPGGFIECVINYRKSRFQGSNDVIYCITLRSESENIPGWKKIQKLLEAKNRINLNIIYGKDDTGNLYNLENILDFIEKVDEKVDFVTADGGMDYSTNFNYQEQMSFQLIFCEIVTALAVLKKGGHFVLKIFDIYTTVTLQYLYILSNLFEEVILNKPYTSRPANSEKYVVCKNFLGIQKELLNNLYTIVEKWNITTAKNRYVDNIFKIKVPPYFKKNILNLNNYLAQIQIDNILKTLLCRNFNKQQIDSLIRSQISHTLYWAIKYTQPINYKSNFFKAFKS
jgi:23S rRNA U2552 (ribose-2'-O)-methylase RlmE/FtsJ